jgi:hypothetical protein
MNARPGSMLGKTVVLLLALCGTAAAPAAAQLDMPEPPFRCAVTWNENNGELVVILENTSASQVLSDGIAGLLLQPRDNPAGDELRYWAPLNLEKGKGAVVGEEVSLRLEPNESRSLSVSIRMLRWARQVRGLRPSLDTFRKTVPRGSYTLTTRVGSVFCRPPEGPLNLSPE